MRGGYVGYGREEKKQSVAFDKCKKKIKRMNNNKINGIIVPKRNAYWWQ